MYVDVSITYMMNDADSLLSNWTETESYNSKYVKLKKNTY